MSLSLSLKISSGSENRYRPPHPAKPGDVAKPVKSMCSFMHVDGGTDGNLRTVYSLQTQRLSLKAHRPSLKACQRNFQDPPKQLPQLPIHSVAQCFLNAAPKKQDHPPCLLSCREQNSRAASSRHLVEIHQRVILFQLLTLDFREPMATIENGLHLASVFFLYPVMGCIFEKRLSSVVRSLGAPLWGNSKHEHLDSLQVP